MAFSLSDNAALPENAQPMAEINVTPLVDVMLVLLIIFMVTAPLASAGVQVDLPKTRAKAVVSDGKPLEISVDALGQVYIGPLPVSRADLGPSLAQLARSFDDPRTVRVFVSADASLDYGVVMGVVAQVSEAGFVKVAFLSRPARNPAGLEP